jgi:VCBS repeat protein
VLERREQNEDVRVHAERDCQRHRERAVRFAMGSSFRRVRFVLFTATAITIAAVISAGTDGAPAPAGPSPAPNWEHIRIIGAKLGVPRTMSVGSSPSRLVGVGDFDGDGDVDIVVGTEAAGQVVVLLGDGSGRFGSAVRAARDDWPTIEAVTEVGGIGYRSRSSALSSSTTVRYGATVAPQGSRDAATHLGVVADFNGDGTVDVAAATAGSTDLVVYLGRTSGGSNPAQRVVLDGPPTALASGDFDGDGLIDLVLADTRSNRVTLVFGDGRGGFARRRSVDVGIKAAVGGLAISDIDADGLADLVVVGDQSGEVNIFLGAGGGSLALLDRVAVDDRLLLNSGTDDVSSNAADYQGIASLTLDPATIAGGSGATSTGTITLNAPAPAGGVVVTITSSNPELAASMPSITVPAGVSTTTFTVGTNKNYRRYSGLAFNVTISAAHGTTTQSATLSVTAQPQPGTLSSFDAQNEGQMCFGVGVRQTETGIALEFGSAGNLFACVPPPNPVGQDGTCTFRQECSLGCERRPPVDGFRFSDVCATTGPFPVAVNPKLLVGGNPSVATLRLNAAAPANSSGVLSSGTVLANTIPNISTAIPAGATTANADVLTARVNSPAFAPIDGSYYTPAADGSVGGRIGLTWLALVPGAPPPFQLTSFNFDPSSLTSVVGGTALFAFAQMNQVAPAADVATATMTVSSSNPSAASIPQPGVTFTEGSSNTGVGIQTHAVSADTVVTISATLGSTTLTRELTIRATPAATRVNSFFLDPFDVIGGNPSTGTIVLDGAAPSGGAVVTLVSSNSAVATMAPNVTVPAGSDRVSFTISTSAVSSSTTVTLNANYNGTWAATSLIVTPSPGAATLSSVAVSPASVAGGNASTGTVTLSAAAAGSGAVVSLSSSSSAASVPASVTVSGGAQSATFGITTSAVASSTSVTITASFGGASRSATLTVTPPATPSAPTLVSPANGATVALPVTLDWNDVSAAASYQIQIDDQSSFSAPRVVDQTVTTSQFMASSLAARQHWWRVRGRNSAGTAGAWSTVRSFTPQAAPAPASLSAISLNPSTVVGGSSSTGTATLTSAAPSGGAVVTLTSSNTAAATVPASVTVAAGATTAPFTATTTSVTASTPVTITATSAGVTRTASLTVTPPMTNVTLTVTASGRSGERVTSSPAGINVAVGSTASASFATNTSITLSVSNSRDAIWSGACSSGGNKTKTCTFAITGNASVTGNVQ